MILICVYYLFSNFEFEKGFPNEIAQELRKDLLKKERLVFLASNSCDGDTTDIYAEKYNKMFAEIGVDFEKYQVIDSRIDKNEMKARIKNASAIFLMGGMTGIQYKFIKENDLDAELKNYKGCVLGLSAGAINLGNNAICTKSSGHEQVEIYSGINLVDISVEPHFAINNKSSLEELMLISTKYDVYAICDEAAIICRSNTKTFIGDIYFLSQNEVKKVCSTFG